MSYIKGGDQSALLRAAKVRLRWMAHYEKYKNVRLTCRHFAISPSTFYLWRKRYNPNDFASLEDKASRRPKTLRKPAWAGELVSNITKLRQRNPQMGKIRLARELTKQDIHVSASTVGRISRTLANNGSLDK